MGSNIRRIGKRIESDFARERTSFGANWIAITGRMLAHRITRSTHFVHFAGLRFIAVRLLEHVIVSNNGRQLCSHDRRFAAATRAGQNIRLRHFPRAHTAGGNEKSASTFGIVAGQIEHQISASIVTGIRSNQFHHQESNYDAIGAAEQDGANPAARSIARHLKSFRRLRASDCVRGRNDTRESCQMVFDGNRIVVAARLYQFHWTEQTADRRLSM